MAGEIGRSDVDPIFAGGYLVYACIGRFILGALPARPGGDCVQIALIGQRLEDSGVGP